MKGVPDFFLDKAAFEGITAEIPFVEVAIKDLPLFIVITSQVFSVDLPQKEFLSEEDFEEYLERLARERFENQKDRDKFIKKHQNNALYLEDEIIGDSVFQFNGEVDFKNARLCGFGILKTQSKQFYMFQTSLGIDLPAQFAAYQALAFGKVDRQYLPLLATENGRDHLKKVMGEDVYGAVLQALNLPGD